jgi:acyl-CoA synthetase (AMP-forming)/AMP-acid ligase II
MPARLEELLERRRSLSARRVAALEIVLAEEQRADQLSRKSLEEVLRLAEAAREEAKRSYLFRGRRVVLLLRRGAGRGDTAGRQEG